MRQLAAVLLASVLVAGCAQAPTRHEAGITPAGIAPVQPAPERRWWRACFRMPFDADGQPRWSVDLLLAERVAGPAVVRHAAEIPLWRFHRRAAVDAAGHSFSLLLFTDAQTAGQVAAEIDDNPVVSRLIDAGYLRRADTNCGSGTDQADIGATSDARWDVRLQRAWPYFIMGVSAHWLALIGEVGADVPADGDDAAQMLARYARIDAEIDRLWATQGQHAYLHHLQALFGYEPLPVLLPLRF